MSALFVGLLGLEVSSLSKAPPSFSDLFLRFWDLKTNFFSLDISDKLKRSNMTKITLSDSICMSDMLVFNFKMSEFCQAYRWNRLT
jgi:hypothetical protein